MCFFLFDVKWIYCVVDAIVLAECSDNGSFLVESNQNRVMSFSFFLVCMELGSVGCTMIDTGTENNKILKF